MGYIKTQHSKDLPPYKNFFRPTNQITETQVQFPVGRVGPNVRLRYQDQSPTLASSKLIL